MVTVDLLADSALLPWEISMRAQPATPGEVVKVTLVEDLDRHDDLTSGALLVLTRSTIEAASGYKLDVFVRQCLQRGVVAILLRRSTPRSLTAEALATRGSVAVLDISDDVDPAAIVDELGTMIAGDARVALRRLATAAARPRSAAGGEIGDVVAELAQACGVTLDYHSGETTGGAPVLSDGVPIGVVRPLESGDAGRLAARLAADAATEALARRDRLLVAPVRTASAALTQLLLCSQANLAAVASRAPEVGLDVDGWHCAARLVVQEDGEEREGATDLEEHLVGLVAEHLSGGDAGFWSVARPDRTFVFVRTTRAKPGQDALQRMYDAIQLITGHLLESEPRLRLRVGIATPHDGPSGLRLSAEESRTALAAARLSDDAVSISSFHSLGARRMLAEWMTTDAARQTVRDVLGPIDALGEAKAATAVATLHAYLDEQGSLQRAAERLHVHRNAVVYRLDRIKALGIDLRDPDERFALQLACRARMIGSGPHDDNAPG